MDSASSQASRPLRPRLLLAVFLVALAGLAVQRLWLSLPPGEARVFEGPIMGTRYQVKVAAELSSEAARGVADRVRARLEEVDALMSTYREDSELSRFNRHRAPTPFSLSPPTLEVLRIAREVSERSGGAFDVTVAPLVDAWGFGPPGRRAAPPAAAELERLATRVGYRLLRLDPESGAAAKLDPETRCDLSAVAKGYAVDRVAEGLRELGYRDFLVEVGGELRASGRKREGSPWRVAIERPDAFPRTAFEVVELEDLALATSGDYRNFYEEGGVRISHTIDPRTGRPVRHALASVSVLHPSAAWADAWATALEVLGPEEGPALAEREGLAAYFIVREPGGGFRAAETPAFAPHRAAGSGS